MNKVFILTLLMFGLSQSAFASGIDEKWVEGIAPIKRSAEERMGASCSLKKDGESFFYTEPQLTGGTAYFYINGKEYGLKESSFKHAGAGKFTTKFSNKDLSIEISCLEKTTTLPDPCPEAGCNIIDYFCDAELVKGKMKEKVSGLKGECGC